MRKLLVIENLVCGLMFVVNGLDKLESLQIVKLVDIESLQGSVYMHVTFVMHVEW